jgi:hypothetical protein
MVLLRSEHDIDEWCRATGEPRGAALPIAQVWTLAQAWYGDRMSSEFHGLSIDRAHEIFRSTGLDSDFWLR